MSGESHLSYTFGEFRLDVANHRLTWSGRPLPLKPKAYDLLRFLLQNRDRVVSKDEIFRNVWPGTIVEESVLTQNVYEIRKAIAAADPRADVVETIPKRGYRFVASVDAPPEPAGAPPIVAVLPFRGLGLGSAHEHLGPGLADTAITALSGSGDIVVRPLSASSRYDAAGVDPVTAGGELHARYVVDGSVQVAGEQIRISVRLIDCVTAQPVFARGFDGSMARIFSLQDEVAAALLSALATVSGSPASTPRRAGTADREAHQLYMKGRYAWTKATPDALWKALELFRAATEIDPSYALAWVGIADVYTSLDWYGVLSTRESNVHAIAAAERALRIDGSLPEAHASLAMARQYAWDWAGAEEEYRRAIALDGNQARVRQWYGVYLAFMRRFTEALAQLDRAEDLDPVSPSIAAQRGLVLLCAGRLDEAERQLRSALELDAANVEASFYLALTLDLAGRYAEAVAIVERLPEGNPDFICVLAHALGASGERALARGHIARVISSDGYVPWFWVAIAQTGAGDLDAALESLERACADPDDSMAAIEVFAMLDPLKGSPRWNGILARMNLAR